MYSVTEDQIVSSSLNEFAAENTVYINFNGAALLGLISAPPMKRNGPMAVAYKTILRMQIHDDVSQTDGISLYKVACRLA